MFDAVNSIERRYQPYLVQSLGVSLGRFEPHPLPVLIATDGGAFP